jgi:hypothetical protein
LKKLAIVSGEAFRKSTAAWVAAFKASSQSAHVLTGYSSGKVSPVAGFSARKVVAKVADRHWPEIRMGEMGIG